MPSEPHVKINARRVKTFQRTFGGAVRIARDAGAAVAERIRPRRGDLPEMRTHADIPWPLLLGRRCTNRETFSATFPYGANDVGMRPPIIGVRHHGNSDGYAKP